MLISLVTCHTQDMIVPSHCSLNYGSNESHKLRLYNDYPLARGRYPKIKTKPNNISQCHCISTFKQARFSMDHLETTEKFSQHFISSMDDVERSKSKSNIKFEFKEYSEFNKNHKFSTNIGYCYLKKKWKLCKNNNKNFNLKPKCCQYQPNVSLKREHIKKFAKLKREHINQSLLSLELFRNSNVFKNGSHFISDQSISKQIDNRNNKSQNMECSSINNENNSSSLFLLDDSFEEEYMSLPIAEKSGNKKSLPNNKNGSVVVCETKIQEETCSIDDCTSGLENLYNKLLDKRKDFNLNQEVDKSILHYESNVPEWEELCERVYRFKIEISTNDSQTDNLNLNLCDETNSLLYWQLDDSFNYEFDNTTNEVLYNTQSDELINHENHEVPSSIETSEFAEIERINEQHNFMPNDTTSNDEECHIDSDIFIRQIADRIFALSEQHNGELLKLAILGIELTEQDQLESRNNLAFKTFLLDLCKETTLKTFTFNLCSTEEPTISLLLPLRNQKQPWPTTAQELGDGLIEQMEALQTLGSMNEFESIRTRNQQKPKEVHSPIQMKRFGLMAYCRMQRKLDLLDSILYNEMLQEEHKCKSSHYLMEL